MLWWTPNDAPHGAINRDGAAIQVHLAFNEGYSGNVDLAAEAIRLTYRTLQRDSRLADTPRSTLHCATARGVRGAWFPPPIWAATVPAGAAAAIAVPGPELASRRRCRTGALSPPRAPDPVGGRLPGVG
jgi:hypothetical protein